jgi:hypothetical protein
MGLGAKAADEAQARFDAHPTDENSRAFSEASKAATTAAANAADAAAAYDTARLVAANKAAFQAAEEAANAAAMIPRCNQLAQRSRPVSDLVRISTCDC